MSEDVATLDIATTPPNAAKQAPPRAPRKRATSRKRTSSRAPRAPKPAESPGLTHAPTEQYSQEQQRNLHEMLLLAFGALALTMAADVRPTQEEIDFILAPAERIVLRRVSLKTGAVNPDLYDVLIIAIGVISYASRVRAGRAHALRSGTYVAGARAGNRGTHNTGSAPKTATPAPAPANNGNVPGTGIDSQLESLFRVVSASTGGTSGDTDPQGGYDADGS